MDGAVGDHLDMDTTVQAVCDWYGPTDLLLMDEHAKAAAKAAAKAVVKAERKAERKADGQEPQPAE